MAPGAIIGTPPNDSSSGKPELYTLEKFQPEVLEYCSETFNVIFVEDPSETRWRERVRFLLIRSASMSAQDIASCPRLVAIGKQGVGIDRIDADACAARNIQIFNTPGVNARAVAELVLSLATSVARQVGTIVAKQSSGIVVPKTKCSGLILYRKTVGILGMGNIGRSVAEIFRGAFEADVVAYDPFLPKDAWSNILHRRVDSIDDVLRQCDVLTIHMPLTPQTRNSISYPQMTLMKPQSIIINAARGGIVNEEDLARALTEKRIWGAGLDCHEQEPPTKERYGKLWDLGVVSTPHVGAATAETQLQTALAAAKFLSDYAKGS